MEVEIISRKLVRPSSSTRNSSRKIPISPYDQIAGHFYGGLILYYHGELGGPRRIGEKARKLEESLANVLSLFSLHAGRFLYDELQFDSNGNGVELLLALVNTNLSQLLHGRRNASDLSLLVPDAVESETSPLLLFQLNLFQCGGMALGIRASHRLTDAWTMFMFLRRWAIACQLGIANATPPTYDYPQEILPRNDFVLPEVKTIPRGKDGVVVTTELLLFKKDAIARLKATALAGRESPTKRCSKVNAVFALIWKALIRADQTRNGGILRPSMMINAVNLRGKTKFPISENACGNLFLLATARFQPNDGERDVHYGHLVSLIQSSIADTITSCQNAKDGDDLFKIVLESRTKAAEEYEKPCTYVCTSWSGFQFYDVDFGWGSPVWMSRFHIPVEAIGLVGTKDRDGVEAWLNLDEKTMTLVRNDQQIMTLTTFTDSKL